LVGGVYWRELTSTPVYIEKTSHAAPNRGIAMVPELLRFRTLQHVGMYAPIASK